MPETNGDCPECEYCCAIGLCCPPGGQLDALVRILVNATGQSRSECLPYAQAIVSAKIKAQHQ